MSREKTLLGFEGMVHKLSCSYLYRFPKCSYLDLDDLKQECRIALDESLCTYDKSKGALFSYGYEAVKWKLNLLLVTETRDKRNHDSIDFDFDSLQNNDDPEKKVMIFEFLKQCMEVSSEFVDMIITGAPYELLLEERRRRRAGLRKKRGKREDIRNIPLKFNKILIENYFNLKVKKIEEIYYNTID